MKPNREILLIDDHPLVRQGIAVTLHKHFGCHSAEASSCDEALQLLAHKKFCLAILDISLGEEDGLELIYPLVMAETKVVVYSMFEDASIIQTALQAGALAYVSKRDAPEDLLKSVRAALDAQVFLSTKIDEALMKGPHTQAEIVQAAEDLSQREVQTLEMFGKGWSKQEMAEAMAIGIRTVETYLNRICTKLGLESLRELRKYAIERVHNARQP